MSGFKSILRNLPLTLGIAIIAALLGSRAFHIQPPKTLPPIAAPPAWDGGDPALVIKLDFTGGIERSIPTLRHPAPVNQFEVDLHNGVFVLRQTDLFVDDSIPLALTRTYRPWDKEAHAFGTGSNHPYDICPFGTRNPYTYLNLVLEDGRTIYYPRISPGAGYVDAVYRHDQSSSEFYNSQVAWNGNGWNLKFADGSQVVFPDGYNARNLAQGAPVAMSNAAGQRLQFLRDTARNLKTLTSPSGHTIHFQYDDKARIVEARTDTALIRRYRYDPSGHLQLVSDGSNILYQFEYQATINDPRFDPYVMTCVRDSGGRELLRNSYADGSRVSQQRLADGRVFGYRYDLDEANHVRGAIVTLPDGATRRIAF